MLLHAVNTVLALAAGTATGAVSGGGGVDITPYLAGAGPFAICLAIGAYAYHDMKQQRDQALQKRDDAEHEKQELIELVLPALAEGRDTVRDNTQTMKEATRAMAGLAELTGRIPTEAEMTRVRDLLARAQGN